MTEKTKHRPLFSILHTSARPDKWREIYDAWISAAARPEDVEYVLCMDERWGFVNNETIRSWEMLRPNLNRITWNTDRRCYVDGVNKAAKESTGQILIVNADDQYPMPDWDTALWQTILSSNSYISATSLPVREFVIEVSTGTPDEHDRGGNPIIVMPVLSRARYQRLGYVFFPDYESMFSDNDLHDHAAQDGVIIQAHHLLFPHRHPMFDEHGAWRQVQASAWDSAYAAQNRKEAYRDGEIVFKWRRRIRFGEALKEAEQIEGWMTPAELAWLSRTASQAESVVEIGSWKGRSTYAICSGTVGNVYAVDTWDFRLVTSDGERREYRKSYPDESQSTDIVNDFNDNVTDKFPNVLPVRKDHIEAINSLPDADMFFLDGPHEYEAVKAELEAILKGNKCKKILCGHDYSNNPEHLGVVRAVTEMLGAGVQVKPGTTIWYKFMNEAPAAGTAIIPNGKIIAWCLPGEFFQGPIVQSILRLYGYLLSRGYYVVIHTIWTSSPYVTREALRLSVLEMPVRPHYVLWTDDDNPVSSDVFDRLLKDLESSEEIASVAGWTWVDMFNGSFSVSAGLFAEEQNTIVTIPLKQITSETKLIEVEWHGFPVVLMRYETLLAAGDKPFAGIPAPNSRWGMTGEDTAFCTNLKARSKCRIFVDPLAFVPHLKFGSIGPDGKDKSGATVAEMEKLEMKVTR